MTPLGSTIRDEAIAAAKTRGHGAVEKRHVLWAIVRSLGQDAPGEVPLDGVRRLLDPAGSAISPPTIAEDVDALFGSITDRAAAIALARSLAAELGSGAAPSSPATSTAATATSAAATSRAAAEGETSSSPAAEGTTDTEVAVLAELDALIGLAEVKAAIRRLIALRHLNVEREKAGLPIVNASKHLVFTGDPGTGKTTVARIVARLYAVTGLVSRGHLVEASRADLVAGYVGQTAIKVQDVVRRAVGGVLFIDEAYSLATDGIVDFGDEAIATLVELMEEHRDDLAVIAAGYGDEMRVFIESNPGLRSRFTHYIHFPNYAVDELLAIFELIAGSAAVGLGPGVRERARELIAAAVGQADFGNARFVRTLFEAAYANMAARAIADGEIANAELRDLMASDLPELGTGPVETSRRIGFRPR